MTFRNILMTAIGALAFTATEAQTYTEALSRGVVAVPMQKGYMVSWRFLSTDQKDAAFDVMRDGKIIARNLTGATCFVDKKGKADSKYSVRCSTDGSVTEGMTWAQPYMSIPLRRPENGVTPDGKTYTYAPNDCSVGDVDADGDYEIILKWDPSNAHDNSHDGYTGNVLLDCYKISTDSLHNFKWRIDLGKNIRAGAHYTQFLVYDFDGDGKAEVICKTAPGSKDGKGRYVTEAATDQSILEADNEANYVDRNGRILSGPEYLTVFSGEDGHAIHTIYYTPNRAFGTGGAPRYATEIWGDKNPGNRGERYLACVAFVDGKDKNPSAVMCRGYYTSSNLWAVRFDGKHLSTNWLHHSSSPHDWTVTDGNGNIIAKAENLNGSSYGQGAHSVTVADVDGDGCDEITYGSCAINNDGTLLYTTNLGHGDAQHLSDLDPDRPGLEYFMVHEAYPYGADLRDARTGEILYRSTDKDDTGRGVAADIDPAHRGAEFWCSAAKQVHDIKGNIIAKTETWTPQNFRIFWDGDPYEELIGNGRNNSNFARQQRRPDWRGGQMGRKGGQNVGNGNAKAQQEEHKSKADRKPMPAYYIAKWNGKGCDPVLINGKNLSDYGHSASCNGTKATPCLQADLFGDWREELILFDSSDCAHLNIFSTNIPTPHRVPTLMHDHVYRMGVAWQNVSYNQPPHLGYYLPDYVKK